MAVVAVVVAGGCGSAKPHSSAPTSTSVSTTSISSVPSTTAPGGAPDGLLAFVDQHGIEVADALSGRMHLVVPIPSPALGNSGTGEFLVDGPVWGQTPGVGHPVIYFALSGLSGQPHYGDVFFRADPFTGSLSVLAAVPDATGQTQALAAAPGELLYTFGCCEDIGIDGLQLTSGGRPQPRTVESPAGGMWFSLGATFDGRLAAAHAVMGPSGAFQSRAYVWVDPTGPTTSPLPVPRSISSDQSSIADMAVNATGNIEALAVDSAQSGTGNLDVYDTSTGSLTLPDSLTGPPSGLAFAPSGPWLAVAAHGSLSILNALQANGAGAGGASATTAPDPYHLSVAAAGVGSVSWSAPIPALGFADVTGVAQSASRLFERASAALAPKVGASTTAPATTTPGQSVPTSGGVADLYVSTGAKPGALYRWGRYPTTIQYDNHDYFGGLTWSIRSSGLVGTGYFAYDGCTPNCAAGTYQHYPVTIQAMQTKACTVPVYSSALGTTTGKYADVWLDPIAEFGATSPPFNVSSVDDTWNPATC